MPSSKPSLDVPGSILHRLDPFERHLLRRSVGELSALAQSERCADCGRTPLVGERVHHYDAGQIVCELCRQLRRDPAQSVETVRHSEAGHAVRLTVRAARLERPGRG